MSTSENTFLAKYRDYVAEYKEADAAAKKVQSFKLEAGIPAINEMRYAAHHIALALDENNSERDADLSKAVRHCQRANYEAVEAGNLAALSLIQAFAEDHLDVDVVAIVSDYVEILARVEDLRLQLMEPRATGNGRTQDKNKSWAAFEELVAISRKLNAARPSINQAVRKERKTTKFQITTIALSALAIVVTLAVAVINYNKPQIQTQVPSAIQKSP